MAGVVIALARAALVDPWTVALGLAALVALARFRINATWPVLAGAAIGALRILLAAR